MMYAPKLTKGACMVPTAAQRLEDELQATWDELCRRPSGEAAATACAQADLAKSGAAEGGLARDAAAALQERATAAEADRDKARVQLLRCGPPTLSARPALSASGARMRPSNIPPHAWASKLAPFPSHAAGVLLLACCRHAPWAGLVRAKRAGE